MFGMMGTIWLVARKFLCGDALMLVIPDIRSLMAVFLDAVLAFYVECCGKHHWVGEKKEKERFKGMALYTRLNKNTIEKGSKVQILEKVASFQS